MAQCQCLPHALGSGEVVPTSVPPGKRAGISGMSAVLVGAGVLVRQATWCVHSPSGGGWCRLERGAGRASRFVALALCAVSAYQVAQLYVAVDLQPREECVWAWDVGRTRSSRGSAVMRYRCDICVCLCATRIGIRAARILLTSCFTHSMSVHCLVL